MRKELESLPRMKTCALLGKKYGQCSGRIQWHHVFLYAGTQINELWAILGVCENHHEQVKTNKKVRNALELISLGLATEQDLAKYPKKDWSLAWLHASSN